MPLGANLTVSRTMEDNEGAVDDNRVHLDKEGIEKFLKILDHVKVKEKFKDLTTNIAPGSIVAPSHIFGDGESSLYSQWETVPGSLDGSMITPEMREEMGSTRNIDPFNPIHKQASEQ